MLLIILYLILFYLENEINNIVCFVLFRDILFISCIILLFLNYFVIDEILYLIKSVF